jgi:toxin ParE1/3/4
MQGAKRKKLLSNEPLYPSSARASRYSGIWTFSLAEWGLTQADRYIADMEARFRAIAENPKIGQACDQIRKGHYRIASGSHFIFYRVDKEQIRIVRVLHRRRDFRSHLR